MSPKAQKLREKWKSLWRAQDVPSREVKALARAVGRKLVKAQAGEPSWKSERFDLPPVDIPDHSAPLRIGTKNSILKQLKEDIDLIEEEEQAK